jgi:hypothetical protein
MRGFRGAQIDRLVGHVSRNEEKVASFIDDGVAQTWTIACFHPSAQNIDGGFIAAMQMGLRRATGRNDHDVHRQVPGAGRCFRDANEVWQLLPGHRRFGGADGNNLSIRCGHGVSSSNRLSIKSLAGFIRLYWNLLFIHEVYEETRISLGFS